MIRPVRFGETGEPVLLGASFVTVHATPAQRAKWDDVFLGIHLASGTAPVEVRLRIGGVEWAINVTPSAAPFRLERYRLFPGQAIEARAVASSAVAIGNVLRSE